MKNSLRLVLALVAAVAVLAAGAGAAWATSSEGTDENPSGSNDGVCTTDSHYDVGIGFVTVLEGVGEPCHIFVGTPNTNQIQVYYNDANASTLNQACFSWPTEDTPAILFNGAPLAPYLLGNSWCAAAWGGGTFEIK